MLKYILIIFTFTILSNSVISQNKDTIAIYFKINKQGPHLINSKDSADYVRLILPPDSGDHLANVKEYYANGNIKLIGKTEYKFFNFFRDTEMRLIGDNIEFYPTGRKKKIVKFDSKKDVYSEYNYFPNGAIYSYISYKILNSNGKGFINFLDCYDQNGEAMCQNGNGRWVVYDDKKNAILTGEIKNSVKNGEWHGAFSQSDSVRYSYSYLYKNGFLLKGTGFDKDGKGYPFNIDKEYARYKDGLIVYLELLRDHLKRPKDSNGKKMSIDSLYITFIVEKNGQIDSLNIVGKPNPPLIKALTAAVSRCPGWSPTRYWGIPLRTKVIFPLNVFKAIDDPVENMNILYKMTPIE